MTTNPIFVKGWHEYQGYVDYWRLVELAGFPVCRLDEMEPDDPERTYIVTPLNGETQPGWPDARARIVLWDLEWHDPFPLPPGVAEVWASDRWYAASIGARFVPLGSHRDLAAARNNEHEWQWDVCLLAYLNHRRGAMVEQLMSRGLAVAPNGWDEERDEVLRQSRVMVHVYQHERFPCVAAQRFALAASAHVPLISEACRDAAPFVAGVDFISASYAELAETAAFWARKDARRLMAVSMFERACGEYAFENNVRKALEAVCAS